MAFFSASVTWANDPVKGLEKKVAEHSLKNGMKLLILERRGAPLVSFQMMFRAGSVDEESGKSGLAHLFEHMMFKGSQTVGTRDYKAEAPLLDKIDLAARDLMDEESRGEKADSEKIKTLQRRLDTLEAEHQKLLVPSEFEEIYQREGAEGLNAFTGRDMTGFVVNLPSNKWELWPLLEADRMARPVLREFYKERDVVMEERRMRYENDPDGKLWENFLALAYQAHPYGSPTIGWGSDLKRLSRQDAVKFFAGHYAPNNAVVAVVGDVSAPEVIAKCEKYFAGVAPQKLPARPITEEPAQEGERRVRALYDSEPQLLMGFHKPSAPHADNFVFDMIEQILSRGRTSRFHRSIEDKKIAISAWASNGNPGERFPNMIVFGGSPRKPNGNRELETALLSEIDRLKNEKVPARELEKIMNQVESDFIRELASNAGMASRLAYFQAVLGDWRYPFAYLAGIRSVTPEDILRVAQKYLNESNRTVAWLEKPK